MAVARPESKFAQAGDTRIHYLEQGSGEPLVCLHGAGPGASGWSNFRGNLAALSAQYRVILPDLPGFGQSDKPNPAPEKPLAFNGKVLAAFLDALRLDKVSLIGNSAGGATSVRFGIDNPQRVSKMILMGSAGAGLGTLGPQPPEGIRAMRAYFEAPSKERMKGLIQTFVYDASFLTDELAEERFKASMDPAHLEFMKKRGHLEDMSAELAKVKAPTLILWGADDRFVPVEVAFKFLRAINGAELHVFSKCGHWVQVEQAERFNRLVLDFLGGGARK
jgi:pimeloyl-ACP methyl ester carboxylesterase